MGLSIDHAVNAPFIYGRVSYFYQVRKQTLLVVVFITASVAVFGQKRLKYAAVAENNTYYYKIIDTLDHVLVDSILRPDGAAPYGWRYDEGIFKFARNGKMGYKDIHNQVVLPAVCDEVYDFVNGAGIATIDGKMGVVNKKGAWVIPPGYKYIAHADTAGLLIVIDSNGLLGLMTIRGSTILKPCYHSYKERPQFSDGLLPVGVRKQPENSSPGLHIGFIDTRGRLAIDTVWETDAAMWQPGYIPDVLGGHYRGSSPRHDYYRFAGDRALGRSGGKNVVINKAGHIVFALPDTLEHIYNNQGLFTFNNRKGMSNRYGRPIYGFLGPDGQLIQQGYAAPASDFRDGYMLLRLNDTSYQFIDTTGLPAFGGRTFIIATGFSDGYAMVNTPKRGCLIDTKGNLKCVDSAMMPSHTTSDNGWFTFIRGGAWGFVDAHNKVTIPPAYVVLYRFWNGYCGYRDRAGKVGYIDDKNHIVIPARYYDVLDFQVLKN